MSSQPDNRCCPTDKGPATCAYNPTGDDFYVVGPLSSKAGIVVVGDIFGMLPNARHFADYLAEQGYLVVMPDFFGAKAWSEAEWPADFASERWGKFVEWITNTSLFLPRAKRAVALLRQLGCEKVGAIGMCWGGKLPFTLAAAGLVDAAAAAHPAFFCAADVEQATETPALVFGGCDDGPLTEIGAAIQAHPAQPTVFRVFQTIEHGFFGARYDPSAYTPEQVKEDAEARAATLAFFQKTLH